MPAAQAPAVALRVEPLRVSLASPLPSVSQGELADKLLAAELRAIRNAGMAKRAAWSMQGMCNALERAGIDTSYWRELADDILGRVEQ